MTDLPNLVHLCVDDFGTGYSSLSYLKQLPIDTLKIDQSFVRGLGVNADDSAIVRAIARLGDALGLELVAEGVETCLQYDELRELGCQYGQGFAWSRPIPAGEFARRWLIDNGSRV